MAASATSRPNAFLFLDPNFVLSSRHDRITLKKEENAERGFREQGLSEPELRAFGASFNRKALRDLESMAKRVDKTASFWIVLYGDITWKGSIDVLKETAFGKTSLKDRIIAATSCAATDSDLCLKKYGFALRKENPLVPNSFRWLNGRTIDFYVREHCQEGDSFAILGNRDDEISARYLERFVQTDCVYMLSPNDTARIEKMLVAQPFSEEQLPVESDVQKSVLEQEKILERRSLDYFQRHQHEEGKDALEAYYSQVEKDLAWVRQVPEESALEYFQMQEKAGGKDAQKAYAEWFWVRRYLKEAQRDAVVCTIC